MSNGYVMTDQEMESMRRAVKEIREERDRYREALMKIANGVPGCDAEHIARKALTATE